MLKRCFTLIYSDSYRHFDENLLTRALVYELYPEPEKNLKHQYDYFNLMSFKKPSNHLLSLLSQFETKITNIPNNKLVSLIKIMLHYDTKNLKFYETLIDNLLNKKIITKSSDLQHSIAKHYICFGTKPSDNFNNLISQILFKIDLKNINHFTFLIEFIKLMNINNIEVDKFSNLLILMITKGKVYEIDLILGLFKEYYKYSLNFNDFYYPIASYFINYDNVLTTTKLEFFLSIMNINPSLNSINLIKSQLEYNVNISNSYLAKIFSKCYLLIDNGKLKTIEASEFLSNLLKVFKKNPIDYNNQNDLENVKKIYFYCYKLNLLKYDEENKNIQNILATNLANNATNKYLEEELKKITKQD